MLTVYKIYIFHQMLYEVFLSHLLSYYFFCSFFISSVMTAFNKKANRTILILYCFILFCGLNVLHVSGLN